MKLSNIIKSAAIGTAGLIVGTKLAPFIKTVAGSKVGVGASKVTGKLSGIYSNLRLNDIPILEIADEGIGQALKLPNSMEIVDKANTIVQTPMAWARMYLNPKPAAKVIYKIEKLKSIGAPIANGIAAAIGLENIARLADSAANAYDKQLDKFAKERGIK